VAPISRVILVTLEFNHPSFTVPARIVADRTDFLGVLESDAPFNAGEQVLFSALPVNVDLPEESTQSASPTVTISIDNVSGAIAPYFDLATATLIPITLIVREYASDDPSTPARLPPITMTVRGASVTEKQASIQAAYSDSTNRGFPSKEYTSREYPGLSAR
jgi:hypothetical protein